MDPRPGTGHIGIQLDHYNESGFYNGTIHFSLAASESVTFENVKLCLYDSNGTVLAEENLGTFSPPSASSPFEVRSGQIAEYIVVDHPNFRDYPDFGPGLYVWVGDHYRDLGGYLDEAQDDFSYPRNNMMGQCG